MLISRFNRTCCAALVCAAGLATTSCGEVARTGRSPAYLIVDLVEAASGAEPDTLVTNLLSDVQTLVQTTVGTQTITTPTFFNDLGRVTLVSRYHVEFVRADGRNTPGVDVPYPFDGAFTITVPANGAASIGFELVRNQAKLEPPLRNLRGLGGSVLISTIANITFYGRDQAGNDVQAVGHISVNFGDFADPQ